MYDEYKRSKFRLYYLNIYYYFYRRRPLLIHVLLTVIEQTDSFGVEYFVWFWGCVRWESLCKVFTQLRISFQAAHQLNFESHQHCPWVVHIKTKTEEFTQAFSFCKIEQSSRHTQQESCRKALLTLSFSQIFFPPYL